MGDGERRVIRVESADLVQEAKVLPMKKFVTKNPYTQRELQTYCYDSLSDGHEKILDADKAFRQWRKTRFTERSTLLKKLSQGLREESDSFAKLMTEEMGKPVQASRGEIEKCAGLVDYYAELGESAMKPDVTSYGKGEWVSYQPLGAILGIMPWNFPFWQVLRFAVPTLMSGNTVIVKHAENVAGCLYALERLFLDSGFPKNIFQALMIEHEPLSKLLGDSRLKGVSLTGSVGAGKAVASLAGQYLKPSVMELGGSDPYLVLADADLDLAAKLGAQSRLQNGGQTCISAKRFFVEKKVLAPFLSRLQKEFETYKVGDPMDQATEIGPIARVDLLENLLNQRQELINDGFKSYYRMSLNPEHKTSFCAPEILTHEHYDAKFGEIEVFGPIAMIFAIEDLKEAIDFANRSPFGLRAAIFSKDLAKAKKIAEHELQAGSVAINGMVTSRYELPFGGIGDSGYGRELGVYGLRAFCNVKALVSET